MSGDKKCALSKIKLVLANLFTIVNESKLTGSESQCQEEEACSLS